MEVCQGHQFLGLSPVYLLCTFRMPFRSDDVLGACNQGIFLDSGSTAPDPTLVVLVSPTHEAANFLADPRETFTGARFMHWDAGVSALLESGDKLIPQNGHLH